MADWIWIDVGTLRVLHAEQLAIYGGLAGLRDEGLLESAMARPMNRAAYGDVDAPELAAAYAFGLARNHPFADGNKRAALIASELFLNANGFELTAPDDEIIATFLALAAGDVTEPDVAAWFRDRVQRR
jgi:death-on-curing protein